MAQQPDSNETRCTYCGQDIPITIGGNVATHYTRMSGRAHKRTKEKPAQTICKGSGIGAR